MDSRPHPSSLNCRLKTSHQIRAPTPVIDLAYENDDGWEILDHKTDQLPADGAEELAQRYTDQLGAYAGCGSRSPATSRCVSASTPWCRDGNMDGHARQRRA